jgi:hypothetical protein
VSQIDSGSPGHSGVGAVARHVHRHRRPASHNPETAQGLSCRDRRFVRADVVGNESKQANAATGATQVIRPSLLGGPSLTAIDNDAE